MRFGVLDLVPQGSQRDGDIPASLLTLFHSPCCVDSLIEGRKPLSCVRSWTEATLLNFATNAGEAVAPVMRGG